MGAAVTLSRWCQLDSAFKCVQCERQFTHGRVSAVCKEGNPNAAAVIQKTNRKRTAEEVATVNAICQPCRYFKHGMCMILIREGCGSCKSAEDFAAKIERGIACPDKPARFAATEFVEIGD